MGPTNKLVITGKNAYKKLQIFVYYKPEFVIYKFDITELIICYMQSSNNSSNNSSWTL